MRRGCWVVLGPGWGRRDDGGDGMAEGMKTGGSETPPLRRVGRGRWDDGGEAPGWWGAREAWVRQGLLGGAGSRLGTPG